MNNNEKPTISIKEASETIGVSMDTLRRWDNIGKLTSDRKGMGSHRFYYKEKIDIFLRNQDIFILAKNWVLSKESYIPADMFYCQNSYVFQARLSRFESDLSKARGWENDYPILSSVAGEIGNNSFDHNIGNWPDVPGIFFAYDTIKRILVLADRGRGILETLKKVKPELSNDTQALKTAFTEIISGRSPESRGNGLKFVRKAVQAVKINLRFQSGDAILQMKEKNPHFDIKKTSKKFHGCLAMIKF